VFDIGGGSSELIWLDLARVGRQWRRTLIDRLDVQNAIAAWTSLPIGVVNLAERHGGRDVTQAGYEAMVADVMGALKDFEASHGFGKRIAGRRAHFLGTSGTVTTISGIHLKLPAYERSRVDGCWLSARDVRAVSADLIAMSYAERVAQPCIGQERADLVLAGCAILEALLRMWPCQRLRVADRGLREGILIPDGRGRRCRPMHDRPPLPPRATLKLTALARQVRGSPATNSLPHGLVPANHVLLSLPSLTRRYFKAGDPDRPLIRFRGNNRAEIRGCPALRPGDDKSQMGPYRTGSSSCAADSGVPTGRARVKVAPASAARFKISAELAAIADTAKADGSASSPRGCCGPCGSTQRADATPAESDNCCATLAKLVARLIAWLSISAERWC
jgi:hypothetical protein